MVVGQNKGVQPHVFVFTVPGHGQAQRNQGLENHSMFLSLYKLEVRDVL